MSHPFRLRISTALILTSLCSMFLWSPCRGGDWLLATAYKVPSEYTNQESGYFSIIEGHNGQLYLGTAKYGVNAYLIEFDPVSAA